MWWDGPHFQVKAVGVCNYSAAQTEKMHGLLAQHGIPLASNQVRFTCRAGAALRSATLLTDVRPFTVSCGCVRYRPHKLVRAKAFARHHMPSYRILARW